MLNRISGRNINQHLKTLAKMCPAFDKKKKGSKLKMFVQMPSFRTHDFAEQ